MSKWTKTGEINHAKAIARQGRGKCNLSTWEYFTLFNLALVFLKKKTPLLNRSISYLTKKIILGYLQLQTNNFWQWTKNAGKLFIKKTNKNGYLFALSSSGKKITC